MTRRKLCAGSSWSCGGISPVKCPSISAAVIAGVLLTAGCGGGPGGDDPESSTPAPTVVALGDSIPLNDPSDCPGCVGFVDSYAETVGARVVNLARGGALTRAVAAQVESGEVTEQLEQADLVIVSFGGNDQPPYRQPDQPCRVDDPATMVEAVEDVAATTTDCVDRVTRRLRRTATSALSGIAEQAPAAKVAVLVPYNFWVGWPALRTTPDAARRHALAVIRYAVRSWREELCSLAADHEATCIDVSAAFNGPDGRRPATGLLAADHTHPSQAGNDVIRDLLVEANLLPTRDS